MTGCLGWNNNKDHGERDQRGIESHLTNSREDLAISIEDEGNDVEDCKHVSA